MNARWKKLTAINSVNAAINSVEVEYCLGEGYYTAQKLCKVLVRCNLVTLCGVRLGENLKNYGARTYSFFDTAI